MSCKKCEGCSCLSRRAAVGASVKVGLAVAAGAAGAGILSACGSAHSDNNNGGGGVTPSGSVTPDASGNATLSFASFPSLQNSGGSAVVTVGSQTISVVRVDTATAAAVTPICTHAGCSLNSYSQSEYYCACHGSTFTAQGKVTGGPARSNLQTYPAQVTATGITVTV